MSLHLTAKSGSQTRALSVPLTHTVAQLQDDLKREFGLETCKIIGLVKGKLPEPSTLLSSMHPDGAQVKISVIGVARERLMDMGEQESTYEVARLAEEARAAQEARERAQHEAAEAERRRRWEAEEAVRTREREERQRIQQAEWQERQRRSEAERIERELAAEQDVSNVLSMELQAFHAPALDASGKILLPPHALQDIINAKLQFPLTFQVLRPESVAAVAAAESEQGRHRSALAAAAAASFAASAADSDMQSDTAGLSLTSEASSHPSPTASSVAIVSPLVSYVSVLDFTAPPHTVSVPQSLLRSLGVSDGAKLRLTNVHLTKATHVSLRPLTRAWSRLGDLERRALLEFQLRKYTFLAQDSEVSFSYHPHLPTFRFRVVETKPAPVVSITDADLVTEILPFDEAADEESGAAAASAASSSSSSSVAAAASSSAAASSRPIPLTVDEPVSAANVPAGRVVRFEYTISDPNIRVELELTCSAGEADLYVLSGADAAIQAGVEVDVTWHTWSVQTRAQVKTLSLAASDPLFAVGPLHIGVRAYGAEASFTLALREKPSDARPAGNQLGSSSASSSSSAASPSAAASSSSAASASTSSLAAAAAAGAASTPASDARLCPTCRSMISAKALPLHSVQCARLNWLCPQCDTVMRSNEREKHLSLAHALYTCLCGVQLQQAPLVEHRRSACTLRLVQCIYCPLSLVVSERGAHQAECGTLRSACPLCADNIQRKVMRRHLMKAHGGVNGKTDERDIGWEDFWH